MTLTFGYTVAKKKGKQPENELLLICREAA